MRVSIVFQLKTSKKKPDGSCPVYVRFTLNRKRVELSTRISVDIESWNSIRQRVDGKSFEVKIINNRFDKIYSKILDYYNQLEAGQEDFSVYDIKNKLCGTDDEHTLLEVFDYYIETIKANIGKGYSEGTLKHYKTAKNRLESFLEYKYRKRDISLYDIDYKFINCFDIYLKEEFQNGINTVWGYHKHLKKVLNVAVAIDYLIKNPYTKFKVKQQDSKRDFLTLPELKKIARKEISIKRLEIVRDIFVFACYTGLSYSDIAKLGFEHLHLGTDGGEWIIIYRTKNESRCRIPVLPHAKVILLKYENYPINASKGLLLPVNSNQKMNAYLKELADICGINKNLSMHVARHTFATTVTLTNGVPIETVSKMLGHRTIKTTQVYARIVDTKISDDMRKLKKKLKL